MTTRIIDIPGPSDTPEMPPWLADFTRAAGIDDPEQIQRLSAMAALLSKESRKPAPKASRREARQPVQRDELERLRSAHAAVTDHMAMIACALGACPECWGHDPDCTECAGEGRPGAFLPDLHCFGRFVVPVVNRVLRDSQIPVPAVPGPHLQARPGQL